MSERPTLKAMFTWRSAICDSDLAPTTRHVALTLSLHLNERSASAHPGALCLSRETGYSLRCVREHLALLESAGWLQLVKKGGLIGERRTANEYALVVPDPVLPITGDAPAPVQMTTGTGDPDDTDGVSTCTPTQENSLNSVMRAEFDEWYRSYPKKREPKKAFNAYRARRRAGATADQLLDARNRYATSVRQSEQRFIKHPASFLNGDWDEWLSSEDATVVSDYHGPGELPHCDRCDSLEIDCTCGATLHEFRPGLTRKESA